MIRAAGGVDLQLLGIGADGHLGFNEPTSSLVSRTRVKTLTEQTRNDNNRFFGDLDEVPRHVVTQGIGTILDARHLVLIAIGAGKAEPIARAVEGPVASMCPASAIQLHPHVNRRRRRGRSSPTDAGRLLPRNLRRQASLAVHLTVGDRTVRYVRDVDPESEVD